MRICNGIGDISFYHPKGNSLTSSMLHEISLKIDELDQSDDVHIITLSSKGNAIFCAGASFNELLSIKSSSQAKDFFMGFATLILHIKKAKKLVVAKAIGKVVGGGVGVLAACDFSIINQESKIKLSELSIGIGPFVIEPAITRKIGVQAFTQMTLNPESWLSAEWAYEKGLVTAIAPLEDIHESADKLFQQLSKYSLEAEMHLKKIFWQGTDHWPQELEERAAISGKLVLSEATQQKLQALIKVA